MEYTCISLEDDGKVDLVMEADWIFCLSIGRETFSKDTQGWILKPHKVWTLSHKRTDAYSNQYSQNFTQVSKISSQVPFFKTNSVSTTERQ